MRILAGILTMCLIACACTRGDVATPRRHAYPRVALADTLYTRATIPGTTVSFDVNTAATLLPDSTGKPWITIGYPVYNGAKIYLTATPVATEAEMAEVMDNRLERISLNSGGAETELTELTTPEGAACRLFVTRHGTVTPVQLLAVDARWIVSGAAYIDGAAEAPDSVAPVVNAIASDVLRLLKTVKTQ